MMDLVNLYNGSSKIEKYSPLNDLKMCFTR